MNYKFRIKAQIQYHRQDIINCRALEKRYLKRHYLIKSLLFCPIVYSKVLCYNEIKGSYILNLPSFGKNPEFFMHFKQEDNLLKNFYLKPKIFSVIKNYTAPQFVKDLTAGIIVAIIALPRFLYWKNTDLLTNSDQNIFVKMQTALLLLPKHLSELYNNKIKIRRSL